MLLMGALALGPNDISSNNARITNENRIDFRAALVQTTAAVIGMKKIWTEWAGQNLKGSSDVGR
jgi:hypothetical protein